MQEKEDLELEAERGINGNVIRFARARIKQENTPTPLYSNHRRQKLALNIGEVSSKHTHALRCK